jgi:LAGLIDADG DNA endonuclease family protein
MAEIGLGFVPVDGPHDAMVRVIGEAPGAEEAEAGRPFCLDARTLVLMLDLSWKPLGDIVIGDRLLSLEEEPGIAGYGVSDRRARRWLVSTVTQVRHSEAETMTLVSEDGELCGTVDHRVLSNPAVRVPGSGWRRLDRLNIARSPKGNRGSRLFGIGPPWQPETSFAAGWLSGFFDGEGSVAGTKSQGYRKALGYVGVTQNAGPTADHAKAVLASFNVPLRKREDHREYTGNITERMYIRGGFLSSIAFLGRFRPERLITNFLNVIVNRPIYTRSMRRPRALGKYWSGKRSVVDITTTSGTFIANGFVVHNCGPSGQILRRAMRSARLGTRCKACDGRGCNVCASIGTTFPDVAIYNLIACRPPNNDFSLVPQAAIEHCRAAYHPPPPPGSTTFLVGAQALRTWFPGLTSIERWRGSVLPLPGSGLTGGQGVDTVAIPVLHPAGIMRGAWATLPLLGMDLGFGTGYGQGRRGFVIPEIVDVIEPGLVASVDIETNRAGEIALVGVCTDGVHVAQSASPGDLAHILEHAGLETLFAHNAKFDVTRLERAGIQIDRSKVIDTMVAQALYQSDLEVGLDDACAITLSGRQTYWKSLYGDYAGRKDKPIVRELWSRIVAPRVLASDDGTWYQFYNALDTAMTWRLGVALSQVLA